MACEILKVFYGIHGKKPIGICQYMNNHLLTGAGDHFIFQFSFDSHQIINSKQIKIPSISAPEVINIHYIHF